MTGDFFSPDVSRSGSLAGGVHMQLRYSVHYIDEEGIEQVETVSECRDAEWGAKAIRALGFKAWVVPKIDDDEAHA